MLTHGPITALKGMELRVRYIPRWNLGALERQEEFAAGEIITNNHRSNGCEQEGWAILFHIVTCYKD